MNFHKNKENYFRILLIIFSVIISTAFITKVYGQSYLTFSSEMNSLKERARWKLGPFMIYPALRFNIGYDTNLYGTHGEVPSVSDYVCEFSPQITIYFPFRNWLILSLTENPQYVYFFDIETERSFNNNYSPAFRFLFLNRFVLSGAYQFEKAKRRFSVEIERRIVEEIKGYEGSIFYETARGTSFGLNGSIKHFKYEDLLLPGEELPLSIALNREERNIASEFYYRVFAESFLFGKFGYTEYSFCEPRSYFRNSFSRQFYTGIRFPLSARVRGILSLGYKEFKPKDESLKSFSGIVGDSQLDIRLGRISFRLQFVRDVPFSYFFDNVYFIDTRYGTGLSFYLTPFMRLDYNFSYGEGLYPEGINIVLPDGTNEEIEGRDIYGSHSAGLVFRIIKNTGVGFNLNFWKRSSNYFLSEMKRFLVGLYITYEF